MPVVSCCNIVKCSIWTRTSTIMCNLFLNPRSMLNSRGEWSQGVKSWFQISLIVEQKCRFYIVRSIFSCDSIFCVWAGNAIQATFLGIIRNSNCCFCGFAAIHQKRVQTCRQNSCKLNSLLNHMHTLTLQMWTI